MQLNDTLASLMRRWYLVLVGLALTAGLGWMAYSSTPPRFEAQGSVLLMPSDATVGDDGNPYLYLGGMNDALDILIRRTNSTEVRDQVLSEQAGATYVVERDSTTQSPIVVVTTDAETNNDAISVLQGSLTALEANLTEMQDELAIPEERAITLRDLVIDEEATKETKTAIQLTIVAIGAGIVGTFLLVGFIDGYLVRHGGRQRGSDASAPASSPYEADPSLTSPSSTRAKNSADISDNEAEPPATADAAYGNASPSSDADRSIDRVGTLDVNALRSSGVLPELLEPQRR